MRFRIVKFWENCERRFRIEREIGPNAWQPITGATTEDEAYSTLDWHAKHWDNGEVIAMREVKP